MIINSHKIALRIQFALDLSTKSLQKNVPKTNNIAECKKQTELN